MQIEAHEARPEPARSDAGETALDAVLAHIPWAAAVCEADGSIVRANAAAERAFAGASGPLRDAIARAARGETSDPATAVSPLTAPGHAPHFLVVIKSGEGSVAAALASARDAWGLSQREAHVLAEVAAGSSNRHIAATTRLALRTVELHVTALFRKACVGSRSQLILALWELADGPPRDA